MKKVKKGDMSHADLQSYRYYEQVLGDLRLYGGHYLEKVAKDRVAQIEKKYNRMRELEE